MKKVILSIFTILCLTACSSEPKNFDDCILKYMSGTQDRAAANAIYDACLNKFSKKVSSEAH